MSHITLARIVALILVLALLLGACANLRTLGPQVRFDSRAPDVLLGPYEAPQAAVAKVETSSDHLRDLYAGVPAQKAAVHQIMTSSDHLRDLYAGIPSQKVQVHQIMTTSDHLRDLYAAGAIQ